MMTTRQKLGLMMASGATMIGLSVGEYLLGQPQSEYTKTSFFNFLCAVGTFGSLIIIGTTAALLGRQQREDQAIPYAAIPAPPAPFQQIVVQPTVQRVTIHVPAVESQIIPTLTPASFTERAEISMNNREMQL